LTQPTLVVQGLDDVVVPGGPAGASTIYNALPASMANKVLVQVDCATHQMLWEGCSHAALIERTTTGTFDGARAGRFTVEASGIAGATGL
jgi:hypothetical protein